MLIPGSPARLTDIVYISPKYILSGSERLSPNLGAVVGATGPNITSYLANASSNAFLIRALTLNALR